MARIKGLTAKILIKILKEQVAKWGDLEIGFDVVVGDSQDAYFWQLDKNSIRQKGNKIYLSSVRIKDNVPLKQLQVKEVVNLSSLDCSLNSIIDRFKNRYEFNAADLDSLEISSSELLLQVIKDDLEELVKLYLDLKSQVACGNDYPAIEDIFKKNLEQKHKHTNEDASLGAFEVHFMEVV